MDEFLIMETRLTNEQAEKILTAFSQTRAFIIREGSPSHLWFKRFIKFNTEHEIDPKSGAKIPKGGRRG